MTSFGQHQNASLYVGDLPPDVTEAMLFDLFKEVGPVLSIRVCRDAVTRRSLGYAYVNFRDPHDAERALETLNYHPIKGHHPMRMMWSHRDPGLRKMGVGNVFIKNLHKTIDNQTLYDTFSQFGNILSCKVAKDPATGESRGYGFVHFQSEESARAAIEKVHGMLLKSLQVHVGWFVRRAQLQQQKQEEFTNIYVKELRPGLTEEAIRTFFEKYGKIDSLCVKTDSKGRPFAFINFDSHTAASQAVTECNGKNIPELSKESGELYVARAQKKSERQEELKKKFTSIRTRRLNEYSGSNLYVKNLDDIIDAQALKQAFARFGEISSTKVMMDDSRPPQSRGFGFVCFRDVESATKAIGDMNGQMLGSKPLYVNLAQRKEVRRATLEIQYAARLARGPGAPPPNPAGMYQPMYHPPPPFYPPPGGPGYMYPGPQGARGNMMAHKWPQPALWKGGPPGAAPPLGMPTPPGVQGVRRISRGGPVPRGGGAPPRGMGRGMNGMPAAVAYTKQARNKDAIPGVPLEGAPAGLAAATPSQPGIPGPRGQESLTLTPAALAMMSAEEQKNALGERLFARINETHPEHAAKITGMLLEMDVPETLNLLESPEELNSKIEEALTVLKSHPTI